MCHSHEAETCRWAILALKESQEERRSTGRVGYVPCPLDPAIEILGLDYRHLQLAYGLCLTLLQSQQWAAHERMQAR